MVRDGTKVLGDDTLGAGSACATGRQRIVDIENKILIALVEVLDVEVELVEESAFEGDTPRLTGLPLQIFVRQLGVVEGTLAVVDGRIVEGHIAIQT